VNAQRRSKAPRRGYLTLLGLGKRRRYDLKRCNRLSDFGIPIGVSKIVLYKSTPSKWKALSENSVRLRLTVNRFMTEFLGYCVNFCLHSANGELFTFLAATKSIKTKLKRYARSCKDKNPGLSSQLYAFSRILGPNAQEIQRKASRWRSNDRVAIA
jgi:hypothetical protein